MMPLVKPEHSTLRSVYIELTKKNIWNYISYDFMKFLFLKLN
jgi:hypothetical protein